MCLLYYINIFPEQYHTNYFPENTSVLHDINKY